VSNKFGEPITAFCYIRFFIIGKTQKPDYSHNDSINTLFIITLHYTERILPKNLAGYRYENFRPSKLFSDLYATKFFVFQQNRSFQT